VLYDKRWQASRGTKDQDILSLRNPDGQVKFFYYYYNCFIRDIFKKCFTNCKGKKMLEVGCGRATSSIFQALSLGIDILPVDYSEKALDIARDNIARYGLHASVQQADLLALPFEKESFDSVISLGVMEHIAETEKAFSEMYRVLKDKGVMISMNVPEKPTNIQRIAALPNRILVRMERVFKKDDRKPWLDKKRNQKTSDVHRTSLEGSGFAQHAKAAGFCDVEVVEYNPFPVFNPIPAWVDRCVVGFYEMVLFFRKHILRMRDPFMSSIKNSRVHFIVARKDNTHG